MGDEQRRVPGTILRGPDGSLYFVPDSSLEQFRVFDNHVDRIEQLINPPDLGDDVIEEAEDFSATPEPAAGDTAHFGTPIEAVYATLTLTDSPDGPGIANDIICMAAAADRTEE